jgi:hypothetical protein
LNLNIISEQDKNVLFEVFNVNGRKLIAKKNSLFKGENIVSIDVEMLTMGRYFAIIKDLITNEIQSKKFYQTIVSNLHFLKTSAEISGCF